MQRDVEIEIDAVDKSGGFIGALYLNKAENAAITLVREGLGSVHEFSAEGLPWAKQLYDAEVRATEYQRNPTLHSPFFRLQRSRIGSG